MQKAKFQIKGMHCSSCSILIEDKLKDIDGIIMPKVNHETGKAVVIYDKGKISEQKIIKSIEKAGDYRVKQEKEEKEQEKNIEKTEASDKQAKSYPDPLNSSVLFGFFVGVSLVSVMINVILIVIIFKG